MKPSDKCSVPSTSTTLQNLWAVLSDEHAVGQLERHLILLETYLTMTGASVWLHDLQLLMKVTSFLADKIELEKRYREPFHRILTILKQPFKMEKSSDEINFKNYIVEFFTALGCILLQSKSKDIKSEVLEIVEGILYTDRVKKSNMVPVRACVSGIEVSEFMECLADFIVIADGDLYQWVIYTALQISSMSQTSCWTLLNRGVVESLLVRLTAVGEEQRDEVLDTTYHMLWRVLSCSTNPQDWSKVSVPSVLALRILRYVLREEALTHAHPGHYNNSLNNISALTLKLMQLFPTAEYVHSGLMEDITFLATLTETFISIHILPRFKNTVDHLQFKKLMLACLSSSPISTLSIKIFEEYKVADCLVAMMSERAPSGLTVLWTPEQMLELFQCALPVVCILFDHLHKQFIFAGLMKKLIGFLEVHYFIEKHLPDNLALAVLRTVTSLCFRKTNSKEIRDALRDAGAVLTLINLCQTVLEQELPLTLCTQTMLCHSLTTLAALMENEIDLQIRHAKWCIYVVDSLYKRVLKPLSTDSLIDNRLIVSVSNFAWEALLWNKENSLILLKSGILYSHIDILEKSTFSVQMVYLSMLTDLSEYEQCIPYLISWRGRGGVKLLSLLCRIWRAEEERLQVSRDENGCISDIENPLMGKSQADLMKIECKKSVSVYDVYGSVRPKIYAIVQLLLHRHREVTAISEEHYKLGHDKLPCEDLITMKIIEAYLPLKMGEIWWEIRNKQEKVLPLDRYLAETLADRYLNWSLSIQRSQYEILKSFETQERDKEHELYSLLGADRLTSALAALREVEMIARTTDRQQQLRTYQRLCQGVENSRACVVSDLRVTYPQGLSLVLVSSKTDVSLSNQLDRATLGN